MWFRSVLSSLNALVSQPRGERKCCRPCPRVEPLEDRLLLYGGDVTVNEDAPDTVLDLAGIGVYRETMFNSNPDLCTVRLGANGQGLILDYAPDAYGSALVIFEGTDGLPAAGGGFTRYQFVYSINVLPVNDAPAFTPGQDQFNFDEVLGPQEVFGWATGVSAGPANESGQALSFEVTNDFNDLFLVQPHIEAGTGTLVYERNPTVSGVATVFATLHDDGGTANDGTSASATHFFYIVSFPPPPPPSVTIEDVRVTEGDFGTVAATFTVKLSHASPKGLTVDYATGADTARAGSDFQAALGQLTFAAELGVWTSSGSPPVLNYELLDPGETSKTITVVVNGDTLHESVETFFVNLLKASSGTIADGQAVGTIDDDDPPPVIVTGPDAGAAPRVRVFDAATQAPMVNFLAYPASFKGGVRVATADVNGDGFFDVITAPGPGTAALVKVFSGAPQPGQTPQLLHVLRPYGNFKGGAFVAAGDVNGDHIPDVIVGPGPKRAPTVMVFSGADGTPITSFNAFPASFKGGVTVAAGDVNGDGKVDIIAGMRSGSQPLVRVFDAGTPAQLAGAIGSFLAYPAPFRGGVFVAAGDLDGDGAAEVITGPGGNAAPFVKVFTPATVDAPLQALAYLPGQKRGVRVGTADIDGDGRADILTALGPRGRSEVRMLGQASAAAIDSFFAEGGAFKLGLFVAGSR